MSAMMALATGVLCWNAYMAGYAWKKSDAWIKILFGTSTTVSGWCLMALAFVGWGTLALLVTLIVAIALAAAFHRIGIHTAKIA
jgi:hypothetical protein